MSARSIQPNERVTFRVRYEDDDLLVISKPAGLVTQPGLGHEHDSLLNGLFARWGDRLQNLGAARDFGLLHRLDREASGLLIVGLRPRAYDALRKAFEDRGVIKYYWAVVKGSPRTPSGIIRKPLLETHGSPRGQSRSVKLVRISTRGKPAVTAYRTLASSETGSLVECRPVTGRLHQVRAHLDAIGCPILGDDIYGPAAVRHASPRLALHAHRLVFTHPVSGAPLDIRSGWPPDLRTLLRRLGLRRPDTPGSTVKGGHEIEGDGVGEEKPGVGEAPA